MGVYEGRLRLVAMPLKQEERAGEQAYAKIMQAYRGRILPQSHPISQYIHRVGERIVAVSGLEHLNWEFYVVDDPTVNCMVLPGGKVFVYAGMLSVVRNEDNLAAVLGHE
eukprot:Ihof_evm3s756 gene=Ihof_evmTU3s756